jgi:hypothetical protein
MTAKNWVKKIAVTTGVVAAVLGCATVGVASATAESVTTQADLDGDGTPDTLTLTQTGAETQELVATAGGTVARVTIPMDPFFHTRPLRVTDINADGKAEVLVTEYIGANTFTYSSWDFDGAHLRELRKPDGQPFPLYEGGGIRASSGYTCEQSERGRVFVVYNSETDDLTADPVVYHGDRISYLVRDGVATPTTVITFTGAEADNPVRGGVPFICV